MRTKLGVLVAGLGLFCLAVPAVAHHGFDTEYDANKKVTFTGVVSKVEWMNPHMRVYIDVRDAAGKVTTWNLEMTSPNTVRRQGWGTKDLLPGDEGRRHAEEAETGHQDSELRSHCKTS